MFLKFYKYRISCSCGFNGTENIHWLTPYAKYTNRYTHWIYAFCKRMNSFDGSKIFNISKFTVYNIDKSEIEKELKEQTKIKLLTKFLERKVTIMQQ